MEDTSVCGSPAAERRLPMVGDLVAEEHRLEEDEPPSRAAALIAALRRGSRGSPQVQAFRRRAFPGVGTAQWGQWQWQSQHRLSTLDELRALDLSPDEEEAVRRGGSMLPVGITPYYAAVVAGETRGALRRTVVPSTGEFERGPGEADDPLGEDAHSPVPGLVHRYPDRVLLLALDFCTTYCRYCTRSRTVGHGEILPDRARIARALDYIRRHREIRDVLISGGDPLSLSDQKLEWLLKEVRSIPHVEFLRLGTKMPAVLPQRITPKLVRMLRRYHPLFMSLHFQHPAECTVEAARATWRLADAGIPLGSQTVLLKGVNDSVDTLRELVHALLVMRVRPYYLYQCDPISGSSHLRTTVARGLELMAGLRGHTSGYAVPTYVVDAPGGGGKIPLQPQWLVGRDDQGLLLRNYEGRVYTYPEPQPVSAALGS